MSIHAVAVVKGDVVKGVVHFRSEGDGAVSVEAEFEGLAPGKHG